MSDLSIPPPRGSFWFSTIGIVGCFLIFLIVLYVAYIPSRPTRVGPAANLTDEQRIAANLLTPEERKVRLDEMHAREASELETYGWIDKANGVVRLPMQRAIELTIQEHRDSKGDN